MQWAREMRTPPFQEVLGPTLVPGSLGSENEGEPIPQPGRWRHVGKPQSGPGEAPDPSERNQSSPLGSRPPPRPGAPGWLGSRPIPLAQGSGLRARPYPWPTLCWRLRLLAWSPAGLVTLCGDIYSCRTQSVGRINYSGRGSTLNVASAEGGHDIAENIAPSSAPAALATSWSRPPAQRGGNFEEKPVL